MKKRGRKRKTGDADARALALDSAMDKMHQTCSRMCPSVNSLLRHDVSHIATYKCFVVDGLDLLSDSVFVQTQLIDFLGMAPVLAQRNTRYVQRCFSVFQTMPMCAPLVMCTRQAMQGYVLLAKLVNMHEPRKKTCRALFEAFRQVCVVVRWIVGHMHGKKYSELVYYLFNELEDDRMNPRLICNILRSSQPFAISRFVAVSLSGQLPSSLCSQPRQVTIKWGNQAISSMKSLGKIASKGRHTLLEAYNRLSNVDKAIFEQPWVGRPMTLQMILRSLVVPCSPAASTGGAFDGGTPSCEEIELCAGTLASNEEMRDKTLRYMTSGLPVVPRPLVVTAHREVSPQSAYFSIAE